MRGQCKSFEAREHRKQKRTQGQSQRRKQIPQWIQRHSESLRRENNKGRKKKSRYLNDLYEFLNFFLLISLSLLKKIYFHGHIFLISLLFFFLINDFFLSSFPTFSTIHSFMYSTLFLSFSLCFLFLIFLSYVCFQISSFFFNGCSPFLFFTYSNLSFPSFSCPYIFFPTFCFQTAAQLSLPFFIFYTTFLHLYSFSYSNLSFPTFSFPYFPSLHLATCLSLPFPLFLYFFVPFLHLYSFPFLHATFFSFTFPSSAFLLYICLHFPFLSLPYLYSNYLSYLSLPALPPLALLSRPYSYLPFPYSFPSLVISLPLILPTFRNPHLHSQPSIFLSPISLQFPFPRHLTQSPTPIRFYLDEALLNQTKRKKTYI